MQRMYNCVACGDGLRESQLHPDFPGDDYCLACGDDMIAEAESDALIPTDDETEQLTGEQLKALMGDA